MSKFNLVKGYTFAVVSAVIYGLMPLLASLVYAEGVNAQTLVVLRNLLPLPVFAILAKFGGGSFKIPVGALPSLGMIGVVGMCVTPILLLKSYNYIDSSASTVIHFIYPAFVVVGGIAFLKDKITKSGLLSVLLCVVGISLFYNPTNPLDTTGVVLAFISGIACAVYILLLAAFKYKDISPFVVSFYVTLFGGSFSLFYCLITKTLTLPTTISGWLFAVLFAVLISVGAVLLYQQSIFIIGGAKGAILSTLEPITSLVVGVFILKEKPTALMLVGSVLVIVASLIIAISDFKNKKSGD